MLAFAAEALCLFHDCQNHHDDCCCQTFRQSFSPCDCPSSSSTKHCHWSRSGWSTNHSDCRLKCRCRFVWLDFTRWSSNKLFTKSIKSASFPFFRDKAFTWGSDLWCVQQVADLHHISSVNGGQFLLESWAETGTRHTRWVVNFCSSVVQFVWYKAYMNVHFKGATICSGITAYKLQRVEWNRKCHSCAGWPWHKVIELCDLPDMSW